MNSLLKLADKFDQTAAELADLNANEPKFRADVDKLIADLSGKIDPAKLICLDLKEVNLDSETEFAVRTLEGLRLKISLIPGVRARLVAKQQETAQALKIGLEKLQNEMLDVTREKVEALVLELQPRIKMICGGNPAKVQTAIKACIESSELRFWQKFWELGNHRNTISETARYIHEYFLKFQRGECINSTAKFEEVSDAPAK